jgi:glycosyltransferase involved in cell wall biosynthesis
MCDSVGFVDRDRYGFTGRLVPPGSASPLSQALLKTLASPDKGRAKGLSARDRCKTLFDIRVIAARYRAIFEEVAEP